MGNNIPEEEEKPKDYYYIYFIENHIDNNKQIKIYLSDKFLKFESVYENIYISDKKIEFRYSIYRIKFFPSKIKNQEFEIGINLEDNSKNIFENKIIISDKNRNNFIFDFKFKQIWGWIWINTIKPPTSFDFNFIQQFEIYSDYLKNNLKLNHHSKENQDLILSIQNLLLDSNKKYTFSFYLNILLECFDTYLFTNHLLLFKLNKIKEIGFLSNDKIQQLLNIYEIFEKNPDKIFCNLKAKNNEDKFNLILLILYFFYNFRLNKFHDIVNYNKNENLKKYIYQSLLYNNTLFNNLKLTKEQINYLIKISHNFEQLTNSLKYCSNIYELFDIIIENFDKFNINFTSEVANGKNPIIDIELLVEPKNDDNIDLIHKKYLALHKLEMDNLKKIFVIFKHSLFEKYINYFNGKNLDYLFLIKEMIIINNDHNFCHSNINNAIHETGLALSKNGKLNNIEILNFIDKDEFYNSNYYNKTFYRPLEVFNHLDIKSFDEHFYFKWKNIKWYKMFDSEYINFLNKIINLVNDIKYFNILFKLLDISENSNQQDFGYQSLIIMQNKFIDLLKHSDIKQYTNISDDLFLLIFYSDQKNADMDKFLNNHIHENINYKILNEIYIKLICNYKDIISQDTKRIIINFLSKNLNNSNPQIILYIIKERPAEYILQNIIKKDDFFQLEENDNLQLFKKLLNEKYLNNYKNIIYIEKTLSAIKELKNNIENGEILYSDVNLFYFENKKEKKNIFFSRLILIYLNQKKDAEKTKKIIEKYYSTTKNILIDLELILEDLKNFFSKEKYEDILKLENIIYILKNGKLNLYEKCYKREIDKYLKEYKKSAEKRDLKKRNDIFLEIFKYNKKIYKNDEKKCTEETEKIYDVINNYNKLNNHDIFKIDKNYLQLYLEPSNILLCNNKISIEKIAPIIYKSFFTENNSFCIIGGLDLLEIEKRNIIFELLNNLYVNKNKNIDSLLIILNTNKKYDIYNNINLNENQNINKKINIEYNQKIKEIEKLNDELKEEINKLKKELDEEKNKNKKFEEEIKNFQNLLNNKTKIENLENNYSKEMMKDLKKKEKEIKELKEINSRFPFELKENEYLVSLMIISIDESIHYSLICKNTDKFSKIENKFYEKYSEYKYNKTYFKNKQKNIDKGLSIEENNIQNNDVIIFIPTNK